MRSTLRSARLRRILAAYAINRMGTFVGLVALLVAVYDHTHNALAVSALLFAGQALPAFAVPALVARVEASRHSSELATLFVFEAVVTAALAVLVIDFALAPVLVLVALDGTAALAASALVRSEVARAAREELAVDEDRHRAERDANAALNVAFSTTFVLGPVLGGVIVAAAGAPAALYVDVASFLVCAVLLLDLHPHVEEAGVESVAARLRAAWRHINETPSLRAVLLAEAVAMVFVETGGPIEVPFVKGTLRAGDDGLGLILTIWGVGAVLGSILFARLRRRPLVELLAGGSTLIGVAYLGLAAAPDLVVACLAGLVGGIGNSMQWPALISLVQQLTPERLHGRMMGAAESLGATCLAFGLALGGALVALSSTRSAFVIVGIGGLASALLLLRTAPHATSQHSAPMPVTAADESSDRGPTSPDPPTGESSPALRL